MTSSKALHSVGNSLIVHLTRAFSDEGKLQTGVNSCGFRLLSSADFLNIKDEITLPTVTLYLYRVTMNEHLRNTARKEGEYRLEVPLSLNLHYLLTVWASKPQDEHPLLGWAMQELYLHPILDASLLLDDADWQASDLIKIVPAELSTEDMMRIWDALEPSYRLSVAYIARVVRIDRNKTPPGLPVIATRYLYSDGEVEEIG